MAALTARETARRLIAREAAMLGAPHDEGVAGERALRQLTRELEGWFGPFGTHAVLMRALAQARGAHPALERVTMGTPAAPYVAGLAGCVSDNDGAGTGAVELVAWVIELLGRLIGDDVATLLVEQIIYSRVPDALLLVPPMPAVPRSLGGALHAGGETIDETGTEGDMTESTTDD